LNEFRTKFDEKVKEIEKLFAGKLDQLHLQNADLRLIEFNHQIRLFFKVK